MKVFYREEMVAESDSYSPSAGKPRAVALALRNAELTVTFVAPEPATFDQMARAHDPSFVRGVLDGRVSNGFGNTSEGVRRSLPFTSGSMIDAAKAAIVDGMACSLSSGFHHACYDSAGGFCTFNGLMVAAYALQDLDLAQRVAIIDCDQHYGNGTDNILLRVGRTGILHVTFGRHFSRASDAEQYMAMLHGLRNQFATHRTQVVLYQAGADVHVNDPLGGVLTTEEMKERDRIVFSTCRDLGIGVAWNLAGGYQKDAQGNIGAVIDLHLNTAREAIKTFEDKCEPPTAQSSNFNNLCKE